MDKVSSFGDHADLFGFELSGETTIQVLQDAFKRFSDVLEVLKVTHDADVEWKVVALEHGSVATTVQAVPIDRASELQIEKMQSAYSASARSFQSGSSDSSDPVHREMYKLLQLRQGSRSLKLTAGNTEIEICEKADLSWSDAPNKHNAFGTLRGRVETLSQHKDLSFTVYELNTSAAVCCYVDRSFTEQVREIWGNVVDVTGTITRDRLTDRPLTVRNVTRLIQVDEGHRGGWRKARGVLSSDIPAEVLVRQLRDGE